MLVNVDPQMAVQVAERLQSIPRALVRQALGLFDFIVELEEDTVVDITSVVRSKIRPVSGVSSTITCLWTEGAEIQGGGE